MKKFSPVVIIFLLAVSYLVVHQHAIASTTDKIDPGLQSRLASLQPGNMLTVIVTLKDQYQPDVELLMVAPNWQEALINGLQAHAQSSQKSILSDLVSANYQGRVSRVIPFWVFNGLSVTATEDIILALANRDDVISITPDEIDIIPVGNISIAPPADNISAIHAQALWDLGIYGQGVVVANMDTGIDLSHPDLNARWRGGSNSWYDPYNQHPSTPTDLNGHGTWTMGVMVAGDASGTSLGVAPGAQWIAVKIFDDSGNATATAIHLGYQWLLDPDGNPATPDAPQVVNNSWSFSSPGCNLEFQNDLKALRLVGVLPVFAAGNFGPGASTSVSPANYPEALAVGAVDNSGMIQTYSSRGPSACGESSSIYPEIVAPGASITTTDRYGLYTQQSGTSLSAPHISGALALLVSAFPDIGTESQAAALQYTAFDLGTGGPDNDYGYGMIDSLAAYNWLAAGNRITPTPLPTSTATSMPTVTPTPAPTATPSPSPTPTAIPDMIFSDGFETGDFSQWSSATTDGGRLSVSAQAALVGGYGMQAVISSTKPIFVMDTSPAAAATYHARFYFSPDGITLPKNRPQDIFIGSTSSGLVIFRLQLQYASGSYQLRGIVLNGNGRTLSTSWFTLSNSTHALEMAWQAATSAGGNDGLLGLWLDGALLQNRNGVANGGHRLEDVQLGPQSVPSGTSGVEYFDAFISTHSAYIGP